jgi:hypothetical protein
MQGCYSIVGSHYHVTLLLEFGMWLLGGVAAFCAATSCDSAVAAWDVG